MLFLKEALQGLTGFSEETVVKGVNSAIASYGRTLESALGLLLVDRYDDGENIGIHAILPGMSTSAARTRLGLLPTLRSTTIGLFPPDKAQMVGAAFAVTHPGAVMTAASGDLSPAVLELVVNRSGMLPVQWQPDLADHQFAIMTTTPLVDALDALLSVLSQWTPRKTEA